MAKLFTPDELGFSSSEVATWDAALPREFRVLVPVHLDALVIRHDDIAAADCRMRTPAPSTGPGGASPRSADLLPLPFTDHPAARPRGVHLHWALPDGLSTVGAGGPTLSTPALPDRWLVTRLSPSRRGPRTVTAWMLDARAASRTPLDRWTAAAPVGKPVTILGAGDAGWAAYYDNVVNRFAFHDPLTRVTSGPLAYLVCGWYADPTLDPLAVSLDSLAAFANHLSGLGWNLSEKELARAEAQSLRRVQKAAHAGLVTPHAVRTETGEVKTARETSALGTSGKPLKKNFEIAQIHWPRASLFHGAVVGLSWPNDDPDSPEVGGPPDASTVAVAFGATPADALAALVARATGDPDSAEWLNAFTLGALGEIHQPDGTVRLDDRLHEATFASRSDGFERVRRPPSILPDGARPPKTPPNAAPTDDGDPFGADKNGRSVEANFLWKAKKAKFHEVHARRPASSKPSEVVEMELPRPRLFLPAEPIIAIQGAHRSPKHGGDSRFSDDGRLMCRLSGSAISSIACRIAADRRRATVRGGQVLARPLAHGGIPPECDELLAELGLLDPGSAEVIATTLLREPSADGVLSATAVTRMVATEQTAWWAVRSPDVDGHAILAYSGLAGRLPSPVAIRPSQRPWVPLHLDWEVEYLPTPATAWTAGETDFAPPAVPGEHGVPPSAERFSGRALLSAGIATTLARSLRGYLEQERLAGGSELADAGRADSLAELLSELETIDVLAGPLEHFHLALRRGLSPDPLPASSSPLPAPPGFVAVRAGFLRITRLRLVDAFGQVVYLAGSTRDGANPVDGGRIAVGTGIDVPDAPGVLALPPRFTAPTKVSFRFRQAGAAAGDATLEHSPVCGWVMPDHIDGALEFFNAEGGAVGQLRFDPDHGTLWEHAPGLPTPVGVSPREAIAHPELGRMADALYRQGIADAAAGRTPALLELLRVIDSTRWTVDPFADTGEEHLALLVGHPVAVVAATLTVDVREPATGSDLALTRIPVRLGALTHWQDGLFGYFVDDDVGKFRCAAAAAAFARPGGPDGFLGPISAVPSYAARFAADVTGATGATPVQHPYIDPSGLLWVVPGIEYRLLLLLEPHCQVHVTTCLLPRKQLGIHREWMAPALAKMAPTFRFAPVLRDPQQIRMPIPAEIGAAWTWTHRADVDRWAEEEIVHAGHEALLPPDPVTASEGWLKMTPKELDAPVGGGVGGATSGRSRSGG